MITNVEISKIVIRGSFLNSTPNRDKYEKCKKYYEENGFLDREIVVNSNYVLQDGYIGYLVLLNAGVNGCIVRVVGNQTYIVGKHEGNEKEYVWRVSKRTKNIEKMRVGGIATVSTRFGKYDVTVCEIRKKVPKISGIREEVLMFL